MKINLKSMRRFRIYAISVAMTLSLVVCLKANAQNAVGARDLPLFDLHGPVKSVVMYTPLTGEATFQFDRTGKLTSIIYFDEELLIADLDSKYNIEGRLKSFYMGMAVNSVFYKDGRLYKFRSDFRLGAEIYNFTYNSNGEITKIVKKEGGYDDDEKDMQTTTIPITILQRDTHGNWTKCSFPDGFGGTETKERKIVYYE